MQKLIQANTGEMQRKLQIINPVEFLKTIKCIKFPQNLLKFDELKFCQNICKGSKFYYFAISWIFLVLDYQKLNFPAIKIFRFNEQHSLENALKSINYISTGICRI